MTNRLLLIGGNYYPEPTGIGKYSGEMIDWLARDGYECTVITTYPYYPQWKVQDQYKKKRFWYHKQIHQPGEGSKPVTIIRCPHYIPTSPTGMKRLLSEFTIFFFAYLAVLALLFTRKFHYVLTVAPPFELGLLGVLYKKVRGAKFLYHIQDLQIDAARDLGMISSSFVINLLLRLENYILRHADHTSTISDGMMQKVKDKLDKGVVYFPNWVNTQTFHPIMDKGALKESFGFNARDQIVLYSGAIGEKQGLRAILHAAKSLESQPFLKFVICGSGPYKPQLIGLQKELQLTNLSFLPLQPFEGFNLFMNMADVHLVLQKSNASDLVMPSKLSTIFAVGGVAIVTANPGTSLYSIMKSGDMGVLIAPENDGALRAGILEAITSDLKLKSANARSYAERHLSVDVILSKYTKEVFNDKGVRRERVRRGRAIRTRRFNELGRQ